MEKEIEVLDIHKSELPARNHKYQKRKKFLKNICISDSSFDCTVLLNIQGNLREVKHSFNLEEVGKHHGKKTIINSIENVCTRLLEHEKTN